MVWIMVLFALVYSPRILYDASTVIEHSVVGIHGRTSCSLQSGQQVEREEENSLLGSLYMWSVNELTSFYKVSSWNFSNSDMG